MRSFPSLAPSRLIPTYFPSLGERNFRIFWIGQAFSLTGTWMQNVGQAWLVLELTGSPTKLGVVSAMQFLPMMLLSLFAGPFIDRFPKRRIILITQTVLMFLALALATLTATGLISYPIILVMAFLLGLVNLVDNPTRQAFIIELSGREHLMNAVSLNSAAFNLARIVGPAVAGLLMEAIGIAPCFYLNAASFLAVIGALLLVDAGKSARGPAISSFKEVLASSREGLSYIAGRREIMLPLVLLSIISTLVINYNVFVPTFAKSALGRSASGYGFLMTAIGIGSVIAALSLAARSRRGPSSLRLYGGAVALSLAMAATGLQRSYALSIGLLVVVGFSTISMSASANARIQLLADDAHRGRVMSVYSLVFGGVTPIGALYAGALVDRAGPGVAMTVSGIAGLAAALVLIVLARRKAVAGTGGPGRVVRAPPAQPQA